MKIDYDMKLALSGAEFDGDLGFAFIAPVNSGVFSRLNKVFKILGISWDKKQKKFICPKNAEEMILELIDSDDIKDNKKDFAFFATIPEVAEMMLDLADIAKNEDCLEPSAGRGALAFKMKERANSLDVIELMPENRQFLKDFGFNLIWDDFLTFMPNKKYDVIVANPPFTRGADIVHVTKMLALARRVVVTLMSKNSAHSEKFKEVLEQYDQYDVIDLPAGTFKEVGTNIETSIVIIWLS